MWACEYRLFRMEKYFRYRAGSSTDSDTEDLRKWGMHCRGKMLLDDYLNTADALKKRFFHRLEA